MFGALTFLVMALGSSGAAEGQVDRPSLVKLLSELQAAICADISLEYEGKQYFPGQQARDSMKLGPDGLKLTYSGTFRRRADGATALDIYSIDKRTDRARHAQIGLIAGTSETSAGYADEAQAKIKTSRPGPLVFAGPGNFRSIWLADRVLKLAESSYLYDCLGLQPLDGVECLVVRFRLVLDESTPRDKQVAHTFWIDLSRGGHVVRHEERWGDDLAGSSTVKLAQYPVGTGRVAWLPASGRVESFVESRGEGHGFATEPVYYEMYFLLPHTLRFDQKLPDGAFTVKAMPGDVVSDEIRRAKYEYGQYMVRSKATPAPPPTDAEIKANLDRMLADSTVMARELKASSPQRDGPGWASRWPWGVAGLAIIGIGVVAYRRRRG